MRRIGSAEVTGSIPVISFVKAINEGVSRNLLFEMSLFLFSVPINVLWKIAVHHAKW